MRILVVDVGGTHIKVSGDWSSPPVQDSLGLGADERGSASDPSPSRTGIHAVSLRRLPIDVSSADLHDVINRPRTLLVGLDDQSRHARTQFLGDGIDEV